MGGRARARRPSGRRRRPASAGPARRRAGPPRPGRSPGPAPGRAGRPARSGPPARRPPGRRPGRRPRPRQPTGARPPGPAVRRRSPPAGAGRPRAGRRRPRRGLLRPPPLDARGDGDHPALEAPGDRGVDRGEHRAPEPARPGVGRRRPREPAESALGAPPSAPARRRSASAAASRAWAGGRPDGAGPRPRGARPWRARPPARSPRPCGRSTRAAPGGAAGMPAAAVQGHLVVAEVLAVRCSGMSGCTVASELRQPVLGRHREGLVEGADRRRVDVLHPGESSRVAPRLSAKARKSARSLTPSPPTNWPPMQPAGAGLGQQLDAHLLHAGVVAGPADAVGRAHDVGDAERRWPGARRSSRRRSAPARRPSPTGC